MILVEILPVGCSTSQQGRHSSRRKRPVIPCEGPVKKCKKWAQAFKPLRQFESQRTDSSISDSMTQKHDCHTAQSSFLCYVTGSRALTLQPRDAYVRGIHRRLMG